MYYDSSVPSSKPFNLINNVHVSQLYSPLCNFYAVATVYADVVYFIIISFPYSPNLGWLHLKFYENIMTHSRIV